VVLFETTLFFFNPLKSGQLSNSGHLYSITKSHKIKDFYEKKLKNRKSIEFFGNFWKKIIFCNRLF